MRTWHQGDLVVDGGLALGVVVVAQKRGRRGRHGWRCAPRRERTRRLGLAVSRGRRPGKQEAGSAAELLSASAGSQDGPGGRPQLGSEAGRKLWEGPRNQFPGGLWGGVEAFTFQGERGGGERTLCPRLHPSLVRAGNSVLSTWHLLCF